MHTVFAQTKCSQPFYSLNSYKLLMTKWLKATWMNVFINTLQHHWTCTCTPCKAYWIQAWAKDWNENCMALVVLHLVVHMIKRRWETISLYTWSMLILETTKMLDAVSPISQYVKFLSKAIFMKAQYHMDLPVSHKCDIHFF